MPTVSAIHLLGRVLGLEDEQTLWQYPGYQAACPSENGSVPLRHHWNGWEGFHHIWSESKKAKKIMTITDGKKTVRAIDEKRKEIDNFASPRARF